MPAAVKGPPPVVGGVVSELDAKWAKSNFLCLFLGSSVLLVLLPVELLLVSQGLASSKTGLMGGE